MDLDKIKIRITKHFDQKKWDHFMNQNSEANFFQSSKAMDFYGNLKGYKVISLFAVDEQNTLLGVLLAVEHFKVGTRLVQSITKRCIVEGGPIVADSLKTIVSKLLIKALNDSTKAIYIEFRNFHDKNDLNNVFGKLNYTYKPHLNFLVNTNRDTNTALNSLSKSKKRQIKKSMNSGAVIFEPEFIDDINIFYKLLVDLYNTKIKKPLPPWDFFKLFFNNPSLGKYFLIKYDEKIVGGIMCPIYKNIIYELYIVGLDGHFNGVYPSVLATWAPIQYATKNNIKFFDFLGAGDPKKDYGVRDFKSKFGGDLKNYGRYIKINNKVIYKVASAYIMFIKNKHDIIKRFRHLF